MAEYQDRWNSALSLQSQAISNPWLAQAAGSQTMQALLNVPSTGPSVGGFSSGSSVGGVGFSAPARTSVGSGTSVSIPGGGSIPALGQDDGQFASILDLLKKSLPGFSKEAAFADAKALMDQRSQIEAERNQPAIQRAVEGAGTSGSSMSALLAQRAARDTAQSSAALGAEQAKAYGGITANLSGTLAQLVASGDPRARLLASILETQMQTDASRSNAQTAASAAGDAAAMNASAENFRTQQQTQFLQQQQEQTQQRQQTQQPTTDWRGNFSTYSSNTGSTSRY